MAGNGRGLAPLGPTLERWLGPATELMLDQAGPTRFAGAGLAKGEVRELDGGALDDVDACNFDAVISRVGLIYFPDQRRALRGIHRVLRPGGRVSAIVYSTDERNPFFSIRPRSSGASPGCRHPRREPPGRSA